MELKKYEERYDKIIAPAIETGVVRELYRGVDFSICRVLNYRYMLVSFTSIGLDNEKDLLVIFCDSSIARRAIFDRNKLKKDVFRELANARDGYLPDFFTFWNDDLYEYFLNCDLVKEGKTIEELQQEPLNDYNPHFEEELEEYKKSKEQGDTDNQYVSHKKNSQYDGFQLIKSIMLFILLSLCCFGGILLYFLTR